MKSVFLDIDGVLQPRNANERFNHINSNKIVDLCEEFDTD